MELKVQGITRGNQAPLRRLHHTLGARVAHPRELMGHLSLVPSAHSSGPSVRRGGITKTCDTHARQLVVEAAWHYRIHHRIGVRAQRQQGHFSLEARHSPLLSY